MTNLQIKIIDTDHKNKVVEIEELTSTGVEVLLTDAKKFVSELENMFYNRGDENG